jgi:hypothetical protein
VRAAPAHWRRRSPVALPATPAPGRQPRARLILDVLPVDSGADYGALGTMVANWRATGCPTSAAWTNSPPTNSLKALGAAMAARGAALSRRRCHPGSRRSGIIA